MHRDNLLNINSCILLDASALSNSLWPLGLQHTRFLCPWDSSGKNTGMGCHALLQGIFPTQRLNPGVLNSRQTLYHLNHPMGMHSDQIRSVAQSCLTLCDPMNHSTAGLPVHHQLPEFTQIHVHRVSDAIQPSHPLLSPSPLASNPSQHQSLFQWVNSSQEVAKVLKFQL